MDTRIIPQHIAIIMDGNGRWAKKRGLPRTAGHKQGAENIRKIAIACNTMGVKALTCYAFSTENWKRPQDEVDYLCKLPKLFFNRYLAELKKNNIKVTFLGEIERFPDETRRVITTAVEQTPSSKTVSLTAPNFVTTPVCPAGTVVKEFKTINTTSATITKIMTPLVIFFV